MGIPTSEEIDPHHHIQERSEHSATRRDSRRPRSPPDPLLADQAPFLSAQNGSINSPVPDIHVLIGTFNLATRTADSLTGDVPDLISWLSPPSSSPSTGAPDIVVIGFQELLSQWHAAWLPTKGSCVASAKIAVKHQEGRLEFLDAWVQLILDTLHSLYGSESTPVRESQQRSGKDIERKVADFEPIAKLEGDATGGVQGSESVENGPTASDAETEEAYSFSDDTEESHLSAGNEEISYEPYCISRMVALGSLIFVRKGKGSRVKIRAVWEGTVGTGLLGIYGNKGSIGLGLDIDVLISTSSPPSISLCFVNSHLGPHEGRWYCNWRNEEIRHIFHTLVLHPTLGTPAFTTRVVDDFDAVFFFGDLNYRLEGAGKKDKWEWNKYRREVLRLIDDQAVHKLIEMDQLTSIRDQQRYKPLAGFLEAPVTFLPSYKYNVEDKPPSSSGLDRSHTAAEQRYSKKRVPAYCDRIMYRAVDRTATATAHTLVRAGKVSLEGEHSPDPKKSWAVARSYTADAIEPLYYQCSPSVIWSDHKPVSALFAVKVETLSAVPPRGFTDEQTGDLIDWVYRQRRRRFCGILWQSTTFRIIAAVTVVLAAYFLPKLFIVAQATDWSALGGRIWKR